jgi:hypothetical protein
MNIIKGMVEALQYFDEHNAEIRQQNAKIYGVIYKEVQKLLEKR